MNKAFKTKWKSFYLEKWSFLIRKNAFITHDCSIHILRALFSALISPVPCVICGSPAGSISLCPECRSILDEEVKRAISDGRRCSTCGRPLLSEHDVCTACRNQNLFSDLDGVFPLFSYVLSKKKLLYSWKIGKQRSMTQVFARYLALVIQTHFPDAIVVPVPPRPGKIRKNGWDQIEDVALFLEYKHNIHVERLLVRTETQQQKKLSKDERNVHSKHAYRLDENAVKRFFHEIEKDVRDDASLKKLHLVLLDDVITTGSTICACASVLKNIKSDRNEYVCIEKISAAALFIVPG